MIVDDVVRSGVESIRQILVALRNGLRSSDNFAPDGKVSQVLTSNGDIAPPSFQDLGDILKGISPTILQGVPGLQGATGPAGPAGETGPGGFMPTYIAPLETFTIPVNRQGLYAVPVVVDGAIIIDGVLVGVD